MTTTRSDIEQAIDVLSEVFGSRENVIITILEILKDDGDITEDQRAYLLTGIIICKKWVKEFAFTIHPVQIFCIEVCSLLVVGEPSV
jgi:hypothetical protein